MPEPELIPFGDGMSRRILSPYHSGVSSSKEFQTHDFDGDDTSNRITPKLGFDESKTTCSINGDIPVGDTANKTVDCCKCGTLNRRRSYLFEFLIQLLSRFLKTGARVIV